jgi:formamidopyrimidine-DNA glycosylase
MPELPEVETVARDLRPLIVGATITGIRSSWARTLRTHDADAFAAGVAGRRVEAVGRRGKLLVVELSGERTLTIHLKMTGQLFVVPREAAPDPYVRLVLELADGREIRFRDIRKFGKVGLYDNGHGIDGAGEGSGLGKGGDAPFAALGPEPLADGFTVGAFRRRLRGRSGRLKPLLMDQSFVAGIGNIYADEALWAARLHPLRSASGLRPADERRLYAAIRAILAEAVQRRGSSVDDYTAPEGDGTMQERLLVYQRAGQPCQRCSRTVRRMVVAGRATHFCSWCQRLPAGERRGAAAVLASVTPKIGRGAARPSPSPRGRWTRLPGPPALGLTPAESEAADLRAKAARTMAAAAARRARARNIAPA